MSLFRIVSGRLHWRGCKDRIGLSAITGLDCNEESLLELVEYLKIGDSNKSGRIRVPATRGKHGHEGFVSSQLQADVAQ